MNHARSKKLFSFVQSFGRRVESQLLMDVAGEATPWRLRGHAAQGDEGMC
jgi:hypothetical protein